MRLICGLLTLLLPLLLAAETTELTANLSNLSPATREHLTLVLHELSQLSTGKFLIGKVAPDVEIRTRLMTPLSRAHGDRVITLESLRLENSARPETTERKRKIKACFTAEILAQALMHNAQARAGLPDCPAECSGYEAALCERLMMIQAKYFGDRTFAELRATPPYRDAVAPKAGLFLVMQRQSAHPEAEYLQTLWLNTFSLPSGKSLSRDQKWEIEQWNFAYAEQAFRNHYSRFSADVPDAGRTTTAAHLEKIIAFTGLPVSAQWLLDNGELKAIPHGLALYSDGGKVLELVATPTGGVRRRFRGSALLSERPLQR